MGRRLRLLWQLGRPGRGRRDRSGHRGGPGQGRPPATRARGGRRPGPSWSSGGPGRGRRAGGRPGRPRLPARVTRRAPGRAGRPRRHRRRVPLDRRRAGPHRPVGRRGRPADRGSTWPTSAPPTTSTGSSCSAAASWWPTRTCGPGPPPWSAPPRGAASSGTGSPTASSSTGWSRGCRGWWRVRSCCATSSATTPWWCWSSPVGSGTGRPSCSTRRRPWPTRWPTPGASRPAATRPRLHAPFDRLLTAQQGRGHVTRPDGRGPGRPPGREPRLGAHPRRRLPHGRPGPRPRRGRLLGGAVLGRRPVVPSGSRSCWPTRDCWFRWPGRPTTWPCRGPGSWWARSTGGSCCPGARWPCWPSRTSPAGCAPTVRPGPGPVRSTGSSTTWPPAATWSTASTASPSTAGWSPGRWAAPPVTTCCSSTAAATGSTCRPTRSSCSPRTPAATHRTSAGWAARSGRRPGPRPGPPSTRSPRSSSPCTGADSRCPGTPSAPTRPGRPSWRRRSRSSRPRTRCGPSRTSRPTWSGPCPWIAWSAATSGSARRRWPCGPCSRPSRTASRPRCWCPRPSWPASTPRPSPTATPPSR